MSKVPVTWMRTGTLWMETCFFLVRRHPNVYMDVSGIPPRLLPRYFPRLSEVADKALFGTDWPGPGVESPRRNLEEFRALPLAPEVKRALLEETAERVFGRR